MMEDKQYIYFAKIYFNDKYNNLIVDDIYIGKGETYISEFVETMGNMMLENYCKKNKNILLEKSSFRVIEIDKFIKT